MGLFPHNAFAPTAITDERMVVPVPAGWSFTQAASAPVAFLTAYIALVEIAGLSAGQRVLIHAGAGGVGQAAIQIARHLGAEVFATAHPNKQHVLTGLGVDAGPHRLVAHAGFRRRLPCTPPVGRAWTSCSTACAESSSMPRWTCCPAGAISSKSARPTSALAGDVAASHPGVAYQAYDLASATAESLQPSMDGPDADVRRRRPQSAAHHQLRPAECPPGLPRHEPGPAHRKDRADPARGAGSRGHGADHRRHRDAGRALRRTPGHPLRHQAPAAGVSQRPRRCRAPSELQQRLAGLGAHVAITACDTSNPAELAAALDTIAASHPLTAVIHAAGVLDDAMVTELTPQQLDAVLAAKADAAWHLHRLTADRDLAAFVLFSSAAGILGSPGQANYAAANAFLDALARHRHHTQHPATSVAWGYWQTPSGMTAHLNTADLTRLTSTGLTPITSEHGLALFDAALDQSAAQPAGQPAQHRAR